MIDSQKNDYHFSFFKPTSDSARRNRNMVVQLVLIWAVAIFGFQILLKIIEKPTPEPAHEIYTTCWADIKSGNLSTTGLQEVGKSAFEALTLSAIITDEKYVASKNALVHVVSNLFVRITKQLKYYTIINP